MKPAPLTPFDVPHWTDAKVHPDHHIQVRRSLYSVPTRWVGRTVRVRADRKTVKIYVGTEMVKMHGRVAPGKRAIATRDIASLVATAKQSGEHIGIYA